MLDVGKKVGAISDHGAINAAASLREIYDAMLLAYQSNRNKKQGAMEALEIYDSHVLELENVRGILTEIEDLRRVLLAALQEIQKQRFEQEAKAKTISSGAIISKLQLCGKKCNGCPHGPYLWRVTRVGGKQVWTYLGKSSK